ncbi:helix-turn-helix domain-containing protein [Paenibacillus cymbidii]|uniref:helix-turn-helix domain-containing protein n=1 Tax=Paenibacillus cymbidii TaxID=1639034 RepID=UPI001080B9F0|nr:AraC family transcriptional regulator [Paenibacillus cymbidii]
MLGNVTNMQLSLAGDFIVQANWVLGPRFISDYELVYFPAGSKTRYTANGLTSTLNEACLVITRPNEEHSYHFDPEHPTRNMFFHFHVMTEKQQSPTLQLLSVRGPQMIPLHETSVIPTLLKQAITVAGMNAWNWRERCILLVAAALLEAEALVSGTPMIYAPERTLPQQITRSLEFLNVHLRRPSLTVAELAAVTGWTHEHFSRLFARHTGMSPREAIMSRRIQLSCRLLVQETWSVKQIAHAIGMEDEHYFSRLFHKRKGLTPSQYRTNFANPRNQHLAPVDDTLAPYPLNEYFYYD